MDYIMNYTALLGNIRLISDGECVTHICTEFWKKRATAKFPDRDFANGSSLPCLKQTARWFDTYFAGKEPDFIPPLRLHGSAFQCEVWEILQQIPYGHLTTYGDIAAIIARRRGIARMSAQAVGGAVGANPIGIIVPCHRVIGTNGSLTGYGGGLLSKVQLLKLESIDTQKLTMPKQSRFL